MMCRFSQLRRKEVINICDGSRLGCVGDLELCIPEGTVKALIVFGPCRFFGLFGRGRTTTSPGTASSDSGRISSSSTSPSSAGRGKRKSGAGKKKRLCLL
ncbi:MAG: YlmC/YmxH family sporulation protein [Oscillospiraceae bacterium]